MHLETSFRRKGRAVIPWLLWSEPMVAKDGIGLGLWDAKVTLALGGTPLGFEDRSVRVGQKEGNGGLVRKTDYARVPGSMGWTRRSSRV